MTSLALSGALNGTLTSSGVGCLDQGSSGFEVSIRGILAGTSYLLKFDAPKGTTDLALKTTADITVLFLPLPSGPSWQADPRSGAGSGTVTVDGPSGGSVNLHLVPSTGSSATGPLNVSGSYACTSNSTG